MDRGFKKKKQPHPRETVNILSLLTFFYTFELFKTGYRKPLEEEDLYEVLASCRSKKLGDQLELQWEIDKKKNKKPSIMRVLWACFGKTYLLFGVVQLIMKSIFVVFIPEALGKLVSFFVPGQTNLTKKDAYLYASVLIGLNIVQFVYMQNYMIALTEFGIRVRTAICSFVYRKSLKMTEASLSDISLGKIVTLITKDVHALEMMILYGNDIWIGLIQTILICFLIYLKIGVAAFAGVGFFVTVLPLQLIIGKFSTLYRLKASKKTDDRISLTQEVLSAVKIIKMYAWELFFTKKISNSRKKEVSAIYKLFYMKIVIVIIGGLSSRIAFYLLIMTYVHLGNSITAEIVYFILSSFGKLQHMLSFLIPLGISFAAESYATIIRLESILEAEELPSPQNNNFPVTKNPKIILKQVDVAFRDHLVLNNVSIEIKEGLNIVVGHVGSGKTTFLKTILESYKFNGSVIISGRISYASQEPWLFPSSIKNNILFGEEFKSDRYEKVLKVCALKEDLERLENGDETIVGDRGINLSKGQQSRINLARAVYKESDIYLMDDCLAALDGNVSEFVFQNCIELFLKSKLCVFVTNNNDLIKKGDRVIDISNNQAKFLDTHKTEEVNVIKVQEIESKISQKLVKVEEDERHIYKEKKKAGKVDFEVYRKYIKCGGGYCLFGLIMAMYIAVQSALSYSDKVVSNWVNIEQNLSTFKANNLTNSDKVLELEDNRSFLLNIYTGIVISATVLALVKFLTFFTFNRNASINLHKLLIAKVMNATMAFFDTHFIGNVLNRFSKDLCTIDDHLPFVINECCEITFIIIGHFALIAIVKPMFVIPSAIFFVFAFTIKYLYQRTGRSLQRLEISTRSPLLGHLYASLEGLPTIRAFKAEEIIKNEFDRHQDLYTSASYTLHNTIRALGFVLDGLCTAFITLVIIRFLAFPGDISVGAVGLAISQAISLMGLLKHGIRRWADFENQMVSVERVLEYTHVAQEEKTGKVDKTWPQQGKIVYENVWLKYQSDGRSVLKNVSFTINPQQKIGIVGRTGSGKSSIIAALFRLYEIDGKISIDGVNIKYLSLEFLRKNIALIPQDPILFSGTMRENLDPLKELEDEELWRIIKLTKLDKLVVNLSDVVDVKMHFSAGQKQLICLARAMCRKSKIIVLDEATANLDKETDELVRQVITDNFKNCTVLLIAHRLSSIVESDIVIVVNNGEIIEKDEPSVLLANKKSIFSDIVRAIE